MSQNSGDQPCGSGSQLNSKSTRPDMICFNIEDAIALAPAEPQGPSGGLNLLPSPGVLGAGEARARRNLNWSGNLSGDPRFDSGQLGQYLVGYGQNPNQTNEEHVREAIVGGDAGQALDVFDDFVEGLRDEAVPPVADENTAARYLAMIGGAPPPQIQTQRPIHQAPPQYLVSEDRRPAAESFYQNLVGGGRQPVQLLPLRPVPLPPPQRAVNRAGTSRRPAQPAHVPAELRFQGMLNPPRAATRTRPATAAPQPQLFIQPEFRTSPQALRNRTIGFGPPARLPPMPRREARLAITRNPPMPVVTAGGQFLNMSQSRRPVTRPQVRAQVQPPPLSRPDFRTSPTNRSASRGRGGSSFGPVRPLPGMAERIAASRIPAPIQVSNEQRLMSIMAPPSLPDFRTSPVRPGGFGPARPLPGMRARPAGPPPPPPIQQQSADQRFVGMFGPRSANAPAATGCSRPPQRPPIVQPAWQDARPNNNAGIRFLPIGSAPVNRISQMRRLPPSRRVDTAAPVSFNRPNPYRRNPHFEPQVQYGPESRPAGYQSPVYYGPGNRPAAYQSPVNYGPETRPNTYASPATEYYDSPGRRLPGVRSFDNFIERRPDWLRGRRSYREDPYMQVNRNDWNDFESGNGCNLPSGSGFDNSLGSVFERVPTRNDARRLSRSLGAQRRGVGPPLSSTPGNVVIQPYTSWDASRIANMSTPNFNQGMMLDPSLPQFRGTVAGQHIRRLNFGERDDISGSTVDDSTRSIIDPNNEYVLVLNEMITQNVPEYLESLMKEGRFPLVSCTCPENAHTSGAPNSNSN